MTTAANRALAGFREALPLSTLLAVVLTLTLALVSFQIAQAQPASGQVLRYATDARQFPPFDPILGSNNVSFPVQNMVFDSLVRYAPGSANLDLIQPGLATHWEVSDEGATWTFWLRQGVQFQKGYGELTSADVKFSFERAKNPESGSIISSQYGNIKAIETPDDYTVVFKLEQPDAFFLLKVLNKFAGWIVSEKAAKELGEDFARYPVGTGPFQIETITPGDRVILSRHDDHWRGKPELERVEYILMPDLTTRTLALINGEVDAIRGTASKQWTETVRRAGMKLGYAAPGQVILNFNMTKPPMDDIRVRKAIAYAIGREELLDFYGDAAQPMYSPVPGYVAGALSAADLPEHLLYERDVAKAKALLAEAGHPNGLTISTVISEHPDYLTPMEIWQELLRDAGIDLQLEVVDHPTFHERIRTDQYPLVVYGGVRDPIPDVYLYQWYHSDAIIGQASGITNFSHYGEVDADGDGVIDSVDHYISGAQQTLDPEQQKELWKAAQLQILEHMPVFPSHMVNIIFAMAPYVDLGYELESSVVDAIEVTEKTRILPH